MDRPLYMDDSYRREFTATITNVTDGRVELNTTAFYPTGGGVLGDTGHLIKDTMTIPVLSVHKEDGRILHETGNADLDVGTQVQGVIDWERRYRLMRMHTAAHLISALFHTHGAKITGNAIELERSRIDFSLESFDRALIEARVDEANKLIEKGADVTVSYLKREEALKHTNLVKLAGAMPPEVDELRIVTIEGIDEQADGGCHVRNIQEIGTITIEKLENKGKGRKRLYYQI